MLRRLAVFMNTEAQHCFSQTVSCNLELARNLEPGLEFLGPKNQRAFRMLNSPISTAPSMLNKRLSNARAFSRLATKG